MAEQEINKAVTEEFKVVADNHMYCGYLDFVDDLKDFKVPEVK